MIEERRSSIASRGTLRMKNKGLRPTAYNGSAVINRSSQEEKERGERFGVAPPARHVHSIA
jgi:hypothetical protein